jgi:TRAP-type C4-dicarboxylate transport system permease small subunit
MTDQSTSDTEHPGMRMLRRLKFGADLVGSALFLATFVGFVIQIFFRYALSSPMVWTEEATMIAFLWTVFWSAGFMVRIKEHVSFDVVYDIVPAQMQRAMAIFAMVLLAVAFIILMPQTVDYLQFLTRKKSPVLRVPMHYIYAGYLLFLFNFTIQALWRLKGLFGRNWRVHL